MAQMNASDVLRIFANFEPSRLKMWEIVRSYSRIELSRLLYLVENVSRNPHRPVYNLARYDLSGVTKCCECRCDLPRSVRIAYDEDDCGGRLNAVLVLTTEASVRLVRAVHRYNPARTWITARERHPTRNAHTAVCSGCGFRCPAEVPTVAGAGDDATADTALEAIRLAICASKRTKQSSRDPDQHTELSLQGRTVVHNLATQAYHAFASHLVQLLFGAGCQIDRNESTGRGSESLVTRFELFYYGIRHSLTLHSGTGTFRHLVLPAVGRFHDRAGTDFGRASRLVDDDTDDDDGDDGGGNNPTTVPLADHIVQPLYQGFRVIVYASPSEMRCYTRFGELCPNLAYQGARTVEFCTFEGILLPVDKCDNVRSWRYWNHRSGWIIYVVDVFRYGTTVLTTRPYSERVPYIGRIIDGDRLLSVPAELRDWGAIERAYVAGRDVYDPIVGVVLRDPTACLIGGGESRRRRVRPAAYHFPIRYAYDLLAGSVLELRAPMTVDLRRLHTSYEMADFRTTVVAYGHCTRYVYLCRYNRRLHQFVHAAMLPRLALDEPPLVYRTNEHLFVLHARLRPRGVLYLRLYYDRRGSVLGYEHKPTDGRYNVPPHFDPLLMAAREMPVLAAAEAAKP